jgi:hypothetical protein
MQPESSPVQHAHLHQVHRCVRPCLIDAALDPDEANASREHEGGSEAAWDCLCCLLTACSVHQLTCHDHKVQLTKQNHL